MIGIKHLHRDRFPPSGRTAPREARPALPDGAELFFQRRKQLGLNGITIRPDIRRIHSVRIVIERISVIDLCNQDARKVWRLPLLVQLVFFLLLDAVVAGDMEALAVIRLQIGIGRLGAKAVEIVIEVIFRDCQGEARVGMFVETFGQQYVRAQIHRPPPELCEQRALNLHVANVLGVFRRFDWRNLLIHHYRDGLLRAPAQRDLQRLAVQICRRSVPVLPLALIHVQLHGMTVAAVKGFVAIEDRLREIFTRGNIAEIANGVAECGIVHRHRFARSQRIDVQTEYHLRLVRNADLHARLGAAVCGKQQQDAAIQRLRAAFLREGHRKLRRASGSWRGA